MKEKPLNYIILYSNSNNSHVVVVRPSVHPSSTNSWTCDINSFMALFSHGTRHERREMNYRLSYRKI